MNSEPGAVAPLHTALRPRERRWRGNAFRLESGEILDRLEIAYWTLGELDDRGSNALFLCHGASGNRDWACPFIGSGGIDPGRWFLISADLPGAGDSSRASRSAGFPAHYTIADLGNAISALVAGIGIRSLRAFCGPSMASLVGLDLARRSPELIRGLVLWQGGFRCDHFAREAAELLADILHSDVSAGGMRKAARAFLTSLAGKAWHAALDRRARDALIDAIGAEWAANWSAEELIARYTAMVRCDLAARAGSEAALAEAIRCPLLALTISSDAVFPPEDMARLAGLMTRGHALTMDSAWGHLASAAPAGSAEFEFFRTETGTFLEGLGP